MHSLYYNNTRDFFSGNLTNNFQTPSPANYIRTKWVELSSKLESLTGL